jgi:N-acetylmuramoyl-L-alanine amidase
MSERAEEHRIESYPHWNIGEWAPQLPEGKIERIYTHWSAHDYGSVFPAYHFCIATTKTGSIVVVNTHDLRENMRNVYEAADEPYAAHTRGRNSFAVGVSIMGMEEAKPEDFGAYPLTEDRVGALCLVAAHIAKSYGVPIDAGHVMSHAEAALHDGYFGTGPEQRWDIARLRADERPLEPDDAIKTGEELRSRMRSFLSSLSA